MDTKIETKEEFCLSDDIATQNERDFFTKFVTMKKNSDVLLLDNNCDVTIKTETKSETAFPDFCSEKQSKCKHLIKQIEFETVTSRINCEVDMKTEIEQQSLVPDFGLQNEREFHPEDPVMKVKEYNSHHEVDNKIEIKEDPLRLETETSSVCDDIKVEDFPPVKSSRCMEAVTGDIDVKSPLSSAEFPGRSTSFHNVKDSPVYESPENDVTDKPTAGKYAHKEQSGKCSDGEIISTSSKQKNLIHKGKTLHQCNICGKSFEYVSKLKRHESFHWAKKPHMCKICNKSFTQLSDLKRHYLIHEGKKAHRCETCDKSFTQLSTLKTHYLIHEGKKSYQCKSCDKSFTWLSNLKEHNLIHERKKPQQCKICDNSFIRLSTLKAHYLLHEGKKPHECKTCDKSFTRLSTLKTHYLLHEGKKPYQCKSCGKSFTKMSNLKRHNLVH